MVTRITQQIVEVIGKDTTFAKVLFTQQVVDVIGKDTTFANLIFTNQYVEVIGTFNPDPVVDSLTITHSVDLDTTILNPSFSDTLTITDGVTLSLTKTVTDTLTITQSVTPEKLSFFTDTLTITDSVVNVHLKLFADTLTITDSNSEYVIHNPSVTDTLSITDIGSGTTHDVVDEDTSSTITITDSVVDDYIKGISSTLTITDGFTYNHTFAISITDTETITDSMSGPLTHTKSLSDTLSLTDSILTSTPRHSSDTLVITDSLVITSGTKRAVSDTLTITIANTVTKSKPVEHTLTPISDVVGLSVVHVRSLSDTLVVTQSAVATDYKLLSSTLTITQSVVDDYLAGARSTLTLTDAVVLVTHHVSTIELADNLTITQQQNFVDSATVSSSISISDKVEVGYTSTTNCPLTSYAPIISNPVITLDGEEIIAPKPYSPILLSKFNACTTSLNFDVVFTYPYVNPTLTLTLPAPDFNNHDNLLIPRVTRLTRNNTLKTFKAKYWTDKRTLTYEFSYLTLQQRQDLLDFLYESAGDQIGLLDYERRVWSGVILNPESAVDQSGRYEHTANIQFRGVLV